MHKNSSTIKNSFETAQALPLVLNADLCVMSIHCVDSSSVQWMYVTENAAEECMCSNNINTN